MKSAGQTAFRGGGRRSGNLPDDPGAPILGCGDRVGRTMLLAGRSRSGRKMRNNAFLPHERVCAACINGKAAGFCTFTAKDELPPAAPFAPFMGFVFVEEPCRGNRLSEAMLQKVSLYAAGLGYTRLYVMSGEQGLYEKYGFRKIGNYKTIYGSTDQLLVKYIH